MTRRFMVIFTLVAVLAATIGTGASAAPEPENGPNWSEVELAADGQSATMRLDVAAVRATLRGAPVEPSPGVAPGRGRVVVLPDGRGAPLRVRIHEAPMFDAELTAQYPEIRSYAGTIVGDEASRVRLSVTPAGVAAMITDSSGTSTVIQPSANGRHRSGPPSPRLHEVIDAAPPLDAARTSPQPLGEPTNGTNLRVYRTAIAATGEFTALYGGGTVPGALTAINTLFTFVNPIFERDLSVRFVLIGNTTDIIYTDAATDPFTNNSSSAELNTNQANTDAIIGDADYDIGHLMTTDGGGIAQLFSAGVTGEKARGMSGSAFGNLESLAVEILAHELGHQFGGDHSFNGVVSNCVNRSDRAAVEPGSGTTIMSYAGICGSDNIQGSSEDYFNSFSLEQMIPHINGPDAVAPQPTGNTPPNADAGVDGAIPTNTPYALVGGGTDANGDALTFTWEQVDTGTGASLQTPDYADGPLVRSFGPTASATRFIPNLGLLASGASNPNVGCGNPDPACWAESLPNQARTMTMQLTARDNRAGAGAIDAEEMTVTVVNTGAAFAVTSQNTATTVAAGADIAVTWNVAGTTAAPINAPSVDILLSTDGGLTFPITLATGVANDGSQTVTLPGTNTSLARIMVIRSGAERGVKFFSISQANLTIGEGGCVNNDDFACATAVTPDTPVNGTNVGFGAEANETSRTCGGGTPRATAWYTWTAPNAGQTTITLGPGSFDTVMAVYTGGAVNALTRVACNDDIDGANTLSEVTFAATAGTTYQIQVDGFAGATGTFTLTLTTEGGCANNDDFACAEPVVADTPVNGTNVGFGVEVGEPSRSCGGTTSATAWYSWTAPTTGPTTITLNPGNYNTAIAVYAGTVQTPAEVACDDDGGPGTLSEVVFEATAGMTYGIQVGGFDGDTGTFTLNLTRATACGNNDDFACAETVVADTPVNGTNVGFGVEANEPSRSCGGTTSATAWFSWTAPTTGQTTITLNPGTYDTAMAVYTGGAVSALTEVVCNDDSNGLLSEVVFDATAGTTYQIQVGGFNGSTGTFTLTLVTAGEARSDLTVLPVACPVFDSRTADAGLATSPLDGGDTVDLQVTGALPATQGVGTATCVPVGATAAVFSVVAIDPLAGGNLRLTPAGAAATGGVVNYAANSLDNTNTVTIPLGDGAQAGRVTLGVNGGVAGQGLPSTDVRLVIQGYYAPATGWRYNPVVPCAAADSRPNQGAAGLFVGPWGAGPGSPPIDVTGTLPAAQGGTGEGGTDCGVPDTAEGVVVNVVAINSADGTGHLAAGPGDASPVEYVTSFASLGRNNAAVAYLPLAADGTINVDVLAKAGTPTTHIRVVILGYLDDAAGLTFEPVVACSAFDSRPGENPAGGFSGLRSAASTTTYDLTGVIPAAQGGAGSGTDCGIPDDATAVLINLVGINPVGSGNLRASAAGTVASGGVLNFRDLVPATNNSNAVPVPLSAGGELDVFVNSNVADGTPLSQVRGVLLGYYR